MMNQPKSMRDLFRAKDTNWLVECDYKALEAWILGLISGDEKLLELLNTGDIHTATAKLIFKNETPTSAQRELAKRCRYALHYGSKPETAWSAMVVDMPTVGLSDVYKLFSVFERLHPGIIQFHKTQLKKAREEDHIEAPISGRRHHFHGQIEPNKCYNLPIQMTAADLINAAMERIFTIFYNRNVGEKIIIQVHDSLIVEGPQWEPLYETVKNEMERPVQLNGVSVSFPIDAKFGHNWGLLEKVES